MYGLIPVSLKETSALRRFRPFDTLSDYNRIWSFNFDFQVAGGIDKAVDQHFAIAVSDDVCLSFREYGRSLFRGNFASPTLARDIPSPPSRHR